METMKNADTLANKRKDLKTAIQTVKALRNEIKTLRGEAKAERTAARNAKREERALKKIVREDQKRLRTEKREAKRAERIAKLEARPVNDPVERTNMDLVLRMVYGSYGNSWTVKSAGNVIRSDCQAGR